MPSLTIQRLTVSLPKYPIIKYGKYKEMLPLTLKDKVTGKTVGDAGAKVCIQEMTAMLACLKANEFNQSLCDDEITTFQSCYKAHIKAKHQREQLESTGTISTTSQGGRLPTKQLNKLLARYKQPRSEKKKYQ